jgi:hypothetical protein
MLSKVRPFLDHSCANLSSIKIIFNITSAEIKTKSADVSLKIITILKELRAPSDLQLPLWQLGASNVYILVLSKAKM